MKKMWGKVKRATVREEHLYKKSTQVFFNPLRPFKQKNINN